MELVELKKLCSMKSGGTPSRRKPEFYTGDFPWAKISDLEKSADGYVYDTDEKITNEALGSINNRVFEKGTLLLAMYGSVGKTAIAGVKLTSNQAILGLNILDDEVLNIFYLKYWFQLTKEILLNRAVGGTLQNISKTIVSNLKVPLPKLETQKKIAAILDEADKVRQLNKELIVKYDALTQSLFLDMFGDPVTNPIGWKMYRMDKACLKVTDGTHDTPKRLKKGVKFITGKHIRPFVVDYNNSDYVTKEVHQEIYKRCNPEKGDVLYTNIGVNLGTAALNTVDYEFSMKNVALLKVNNGFLIGRFLEHFLNSPNMKEKILWIASIGGAQKFLSLTQIRRLIVLAPPIQLQNQFAERVQIIENQKQQAQESLQKSEDLFNSLLQKAFKGELVK
jgi:type I restriction enzyme S subunit